ncbi:MAG: MMPL family transporter, partial [Lachnospiraceae bacterium]|nr:MMPL family transporter [Lachnospiraceae bacterium]
MQKIARGIVKLRFVILALAIFLLIPSGIGYVKTRVNYDILTYLPKNIETMKGQDILEKDFGTGAYSMYIVKGMEYKEVAALKKQIEKIPHVQNVLWYDSVMDISVPKEVIPKKYRAAFDSGDATMMFIVFDQTTSSDETMNAVKQIRKVSGKSCFLAGMSGLVEDTKELAEKETPIYVMIAVLLAVIVLSLTMDSYLIPIFFLLSIGMAIVYNLGSNVFLGEISFITKCIAAVLQLGVTMDYSIFLWHSYLEEQENTNGDKKEAMARAIAATFQSVIGSSVTTIAGFIALCFMSFTIGRDLGIVMAKGVVFGVIACITILPSMILVFDRPLEATRHKPLLPEFKRLPKLISKRFYVFGLLFLVILPFALYGQGHTKVYYNLGGTLPASLPSMQASKELDENFTSNTTYMILYNKNLSSGDKAEMLSKLQDVKGVDKAIGLNTFVGPSVPENMIPQKIRTMLQSDKYEMALITSKYKVASDAVNNQITKVNKIVKSYDTKAMVVGEAPCTKDLIRIT